MQQYKALEKPSNLTRKLDSRYVRVIGIAFVLVYDALYYTTSQL